MQTKKKVLIGGLSTAAVVAGVALTGGTSAYYYDLERSEGNTFSACSLDLEQAHVSVTPVGNSDPNKGGTTASTTGGLDATGALSTITLQNLEPGDQYKVRFDLKNAGSCDGELWGDVNFPIDDLENGILEPEAEANDTTENDGELDDVMLVDYRADSSADPAGNIFHGTYHDLAYKRPYLLDPNFEAGETVVISALFKVPDNGAGAENNIMGDSFTFAIDFAAAQKDKIPHPAGSNEADAPTDLNALGVGGMQP